MEEKNVKVTGTASDAEVIRDYLKEHATLRANKDCDVYNLPKKEYYKLASDNYGLTAETMDKFNEFHSALIDGAYLLNSEHIREKIDALDDKSDLDAVKNIKSVVNFTTFNGSLSVSNKAYKSTFSQVKVGQPELGRKEIVSINKTAVDWDLSLSVDASIRDEEENKMRELLGLPRIGDDEDTAASA